MRRTGALRAALAALALLLGGGAAADARAQDPGTREGRGPDALWEAYPLDQRPSPAGDGRPVAEQDAAPTGTRVAFSRQEPREAPALAIVTGVCLAAGLLLSAGGLVLARRERNRRLWA